jgi:hypothetical protein
MGLLQRNVSTHCKTRFAGDTANAPRKAARVLRQRIEFRRSTLEILLPLRDFL